MRKFLIAYLPASLLLAFLSMVLFTCGGGGGGGGGPSTSTFTGSVSGTLILAVDENGTIAAQDDTAGKTQDADGHFPISLTVPVGHQYTIYFIVEDGPPPTERIVPLFSGTTNIFSVTGGGTIDLGFVDTTQAEATAENDPLTSKGVTDGGTTGPDTITTQNSNPILILINRSDVGIKYRTQVFVRNADGSDLKDGTLVKDVVVYDPNGQELPLDENLNFYYFDGLNEYGDGGSGPIPTPSSDIEAYLAASPGSLPDGFYTELITDSNGNLHLAKMYFEQPTEVEKPTNLAQVVNLDGSITLSWINPTGAEAGYNLRLEIRHSDENGDGFTDTALGVGRDTSTNFYTVPASYVSSNLAGKQELIWRVQVRQNVGPILFPDMTNRTVQIYRNYSEDQPLSLTPPTAIPFTSEMLAGKVFVPTPESPGDADLIMFADTTGTDYHSYFDNMGNPVFDMFTWNWSVVDGRLLVDNPAPEPDYVVTLLADTETYLDVQLEGGGETRSDRLTKVIPFDEAEVPGTYLIVGGTSITFSSDRTGSIIENSVPEDFTWSLDADGVMTVTLINGPITLYRLATSTSSTLHIIGIDYQDSIPIEVFASTLIRQ